MAHKASILAIRAYGKAAARTCLQKLEYKIRTTTIWREVCRQREFVDAQRRLEFLFFEKRPLEQKWGRPKG